MEQDEAVLSFIEEVRREFGTESDEFAAVELAGTVEEAKSGMEMVLNQFADQEEGTDRPGEFFDVDPNQYSVTEDPTNTGVAPHVVKNAVKGLDLGVPVSVVHDPNWEHNGKRVRAAVGPKGIVLNAANIRSKDDAKAALLHEAVGHSGVNAVLGEKFGKEMYRLGATLSPSQRANLEVVARRYGLDLESTDGLVAAVAELVALDAETPIQRGIARRFLDSIQKFLNRTFGTKFGDAEVRSLLAKARAYVDSQKNAPVAEDTQHSLSGAVLSETDQAYMEAVESGDVETQQRMVDEAAKAAGYDIDKKLYHGTSARFEIPRTNNNIALYLTDDIDTAESFADASEEGGRFTKVDDIESALVLSVYIKGDIFNPSEDADIQRITGNVNKGAISELASGDYGFNVYEKYNIFRGLKKVGYSGHYETEGWGSSLDTVAMYDATQIKSADPIAYDPDGNVIPLSERFQSDNPDINYSIIDNPDAERVEAQAEAGPPEPVEVASDVPAPPGLLARVASRPTEILRRFSPALLEALKKLKLMSASQAAAVRTQAEHLIRQVEQSFFDTNPDPSAWKLPKFLGMGAWAKRFKKFMNLSLPLAAHLNATGRKDGEFVFDEFEMRAGSLSKKDFDKLGTNVGDTLPHQNPLTGENEELNVGEFVEGYGYSLTRTMTADQQQDLYNDYAEEYPDAIWFVNMFIDPALANVRQTINGVEIPVFNRFALESKMRENDPNFIGVLGYTPDVITSRSFLGITKMITDGQGLAAGKTSPGRRYKSGRARESGNVKNLLDGFNERTLQVLQENDRREWHQAILNSAVAIPTTGIPKGYSDISTGMNQVWDAIQAMKSANLAEMPETQARLQDDGSDSKAFSAFFGEAAQLRGQRKMLPTKIVHDLISRNVAQEVHGRLFNLMRWALRNGQQLILAMPATFINNFLTNEVFTATEMLKHSIAGIAKIPFNREASMKDFHTVHETMRGLLAHRFNGRLDKDFKQATNDILPQEVFEDQTMLSDLKMKSGKVIDLLMRGEFGSAILQGFGYGEIDIRPKQRMAYAILRANAKEWAKKSGKSVEEYMKNPPMEDRTAAIEAVGIAFLNYSNSPEWLSKFKKQWWQPLVWQFPSFSYHYLAKQGHRVTGLKRMFTGKTTEEKIDGFAEAATFGLGVGGGLGLALNALLDDDDDIREIVGTGWVWQEDLAGDLVKKNLPRDVSNANRLAIGGLLRALGLGDPDQEDDFWLRVRYYPQLSMGGAMALAVNDAEKYGAWKGVQTYSHTFWDLLGDFVSIGYLPKIALHRKSGNPIDPFATGVPWSYYATDKVLEAFVPGSRQASELALIWDPQYHRTTESAALGYKPGPMEAFRTEHWSGLINRVMGNLDDVPNAGRVELTSSRPQRGRSGKRSRGIHKDAKEQGEDSPNVRRFTDSAGRRKLAVVPKVNQRKVNQPLNFARMLSANIKVSNQKALKEALEQEAAGR